MRRFLDLARVILTTPSLWGDLPASESYLLADGIVLIAGMVAVLLKLILFIHSRLCTPDDVPDAYAEEVEAQPMASEAPV